MKKFYLFAGLWVALFAAKAQNVATFEDVPLNTDSYWNGSDGSGGIVSGSFTFPNLYTTSEYGDYWSGFAVSNMKDATTAGWTNQYSAITASGANQSENYAVVYASGGLQMEFKNPLQLTGFYVTNSTYAYLSMENGDAVAKMFGGDDGNDPDYFKLIVSGSDIYGNETAPVEFYLADFTAENSGEDYILNSWEWVDLGSLGVVSSVTFKLESTDNGDWGMNTPAYFCMDDFNGTSPEMPFIVAEASIEDMALGADDFYNGSDETGNFVSGGFTFLNDYNTEWGSWSGFAASTVTDNETGGWANQYSAIPGSGAIGTSAYAVSYGSSEIHFEKTVISGLYITNSAYAYFSMLNGDDYAKKFGGEIGTEPDWFKLDIHGISEEGDTIGTIEYYLADFRAENSSEDYITDDWIWVDLSSLGEITKLRFGLSSSDNSSWGMNTPGYFCIDQVNHQDMAPQIVHPIATINKPTYSSHAYSINLNQVFSDPDNDDSEITLKLENIDNSELLSGYIFEEITPEEITTLLSLTIASGMTGTANITISATSNGKTVYHSFKMIVSFPVSSEFTALEKNNIKVYPNPVHSDFNLELPAKTEQVVLFDISGKIIYTNTAIRNQNITISALQNSPSGIYFLKVKSGSEYKTEKIVKL